LLLGFGCLLASTAFNAAMLTNRNGRTVWPRQIYDLRFHKIRKWRERHASLNRGKESSAAYGDDVDRPDDEESENCETDDAPDSFAVSTHGRLTVTGVVKSAD
jgi:hypothetical protein